MIVWRRVAADNASLNVGQYRYAIGPSRFVTDTFL